MQIGFPVAQMVKNLPAMQEIWVPSLGWEDPLEEGMTTHSNILAQRQSSLDGYSASNRKELDMTERLHFIIDIESSDRPEVDVCREMKSMGHKRRSNRQLEI